MTIYNDFMVRKFCEQRDREIRADRKHRTQVKDAKDQKQAWRGIIPYKLCDKKR